MGEVPSVDDVFSASQWWGVLEGHLGDQFVADQRGGVWPKAKEWDHGKAGEIQEEMENIAKEAGILEGVRNAHLYDLGWLATRMLSKHGKRLINGRDPCPGRCRTRKGPISKRGCKKQCKIGQPVERIVKLDFERREELSNFIGSVKYKNCCGRMKNCPIPK